MILSPMQAQLLEISLPEGAFFAQGDVLFVVEAMKMQHEIRASVPGQLQRILVDLGQWLQAYEVLAYYQDLDLTGQEQAPNRHQVSFYPDQVASPPSNLDGLPTSIADDLDKSSSQPTAGLNKTLVLHNSDSNSEPRLSAVREDLQQVQQRKDLLLDSARPEAVKKRRDSGKRTARQNIADLCGPNFIEYGAFAVAAQSSRRPLEELIHQTPADGLITGIASVNRDKFEESLTQVAVMAYDATVLAGTQGYRNHQKTDRILDLALQHRLPLVLFAEGGGGRPGDVDIPMVAGLHVASFSKMAALNGKLPSIGIVAGRCFAGNAALLGCCDLIIATEDSNIGMGGPVMIEGAGLGVVSPEQIGPSEIQNSNGVIDILVKDEAQAVEVAKKYLAFFQGAYWNQKEPPVQALRDVLPTSRARSYASDLVLELIADPDSLLFLKTGFGQGIHTALGRIKGRTVGFMVNNPMHLGGAIDPEAADKASRFMQLCNAHQLPIVSLVDTPGFMVGPEIESQAQVRHTSRMLIAAAHLRVPFIAVIMRKAYGLGAMSMTAGGFHVPIATLAWPSAECGAMGIEGAVRLGYKKELMALPEGQARQALMDDLIEQAIAKGSALSMAMHLEIDDVIDPACTRQMIHDLLLASKINPSPDSTSYMIDAI